MITEHSLDMVRKNLDSFSLAPDSITGHTLPGDRNIRRCFEA